MAYNYLGLLNDLCYKFNEVPVTEAGFNSVNGVYLDFKNSINNSLRDIGNEVYEWPFSHQTEELVLTPDTSRYPMPADSKTVNLDSFRIKRDATFNTPTVKLSVLDYEEYLEKYIDAEYSLGEHSDVPRNIIRCPDLTFALYPPPDNAYTLVYEYYTLAPSLVNALDVPFVPESFRFVILDGAYGYASLFRGDAESAAVMLQKQQEGIKNMRTIYQNRYEYVRSGAINRIR